MGETLLWIAVLICGAFAVFGFWISTNQDVAERLLHKFRKQKHQDDEMLGDELDDGQRKKGRRNKNGVGTDVAGSTYNLLEFDKLHKGMITFKKDPDYFVMGLGIQGVNINMYTDVEKLSLKNGFINILNGLKDDTQFLVQSRYVDLADNFSYFRPTIEDNKKEIERLQQRVHDEKSDVLKKKIIKYISNAKAKNEYAQHIIDFFDFYIKQSKCISINIYMFTSYRYIPKNNFSFSREKIIEEAYSTLSNRVKLFQEQFNSIGLKAHSLNSVEIADVMYSSLVKNESSYMKLEDALKNGLLDIAIQDMGADSRTEIGEIKYKDKYAYPYQDDASTFI